MLLKYFYDDKLAHASYMVGCAATGEAIIVDPGRNITPYLEAARKEAMHITHITETHIHADFVSGSRELAAATGATLYLSEMGGPDWQYQFADDNTVLLRDGDWWMVGNIRFEAIHTPGHTPEHMAYLVTDTAGADKPIGAFTGDFIFVGDIGRPDLLETAAGVAGAKAIGARQQFQSVKQFKAMPDYLQIWPAHGAGSACGKALGSVPSSTLGYEKLFSPGFQYEEEDAFVAWILADQPETPRYFGQMKRVNKEGPALLADLAAPERLPYEQLAPIIERGDLVIDARSLKACDTCYIPGTLTIPLNNKFNTFAGWFVDFDKPTYLIAPERLVTELISDLRAVGVDDLPGYFLTEDVLPRLEDQSVAIPQIDAADLARQIERNNVTVVDVRGATEHQEKRIAGAKNIPMGYLPQHIDEFAQDEAIIMHCVNGIRSMIGASLLWKHGLTNVVTLSDDISDWETAGLPVEKG